MTDDTQSPAGGALSVSGLPQRIGWICRSVRYTALAWFGWSFAIFLFVWFDREHYLDRTARFHGIDPESITTGAYWAAFAVVMMEYALVAWVVRRIWILVQGYLDGDIFTVSAAERLHKLALAGLVATAGNLIERPLQLGILSTQFLSKLPLWGWLDPNNLLYLLFCGFILAIAAIFRTAAALADEHAQIV